MTLSTKPCLLSLSIEIQMTPAVKYRRLTFYQLGLLADHDCGLQDVAFRFDSLLRCYPC